MKIEGSEETENYGKTLKKGEIYIIGRSVEGDTERK